MMPLYFQNTCIKELVFLNFETRLFLNSFFNFKMKHKKGLAKILHVSHDQWVDTCPIRV